MADLVLSLPDEAVEAIAEQLAQRMTLPAPAPVGDVNERIALPRTEAAAALGMSVDSFERHVAHEIRVIRKGRMRLYRRADLEVWAAENAARPLREAA